MNRRQFLKLVGLSALLYPVARPVLAMETRIPVHGENLELYTKTAYLMGSLFHFSVYTSDKREAEQVVLRAIARVRELESLWSVFKEDSVISRINAAAGKQQIAVDPETLNLLTTSLHAWQLTGGVFDPGIEPLMKIYGFRQESDEFVNFPDDKLLATLESAIGIKNLQVSDSEAGLIHPLSGLDTGGIACGFALDEAVKILRESGIQSALLNFSGDLFAIGKPPFSDRWPVEIVNPVQSEYPLKVTICEQALSTSGAYENRRSSKELSWGHLIDPVKRQPSEPVQSVTIISSTATEGDYLSTAVFIRPELGMQLLSSKSIDDLLIIP